MGWIVAALIVAALIVGGGVALVKAVNAKDKNPIKDAAESCGVTQYLGDRGASISLRAFGSLEWSADNNTGAQCLLKELEAPDRVITQMNQTRGVDGTLEASWGDFNAFWSYHPDNGFNLTVYEAD